MYQIELCAVCDKRKCGATVILSILPPDKKRFDLESASMELICPACGKPFTVLITQIERANVSEKHLQQGFFGGRRSARGESAGASSD